MRIGRKTIWAAALPLSLALHCKAGTSEAEPVLTVAVQNYAGLPAQTLAKAEAVASSIFRKAGIILRWVDHPTSSQNVAYPQDAVPAVQRRVFVKLLPDSMAGRLGHALNKFGVAIPPQEAYIFADGVKTLAVNKGLSEPPTLGCVIAHEIGHLLLGADSHADGGIMVADIRVRVFRLAAQGIPPTFTPAQARQLLARLR